MFQVTKLFLTDQTALFHHSIAMDLFSKTALLPHEVAFSKFMSVCHVRVFYIGVAMVCGVMSFRTILVLLRCVLVVSLVSNRGWVVFGCDVDGVVAGVGDGADQQRKINNESLYALYAFCFGSRLNDTTINIEKQGPSTKTGVLILLW